MTSSELTATIAYLRELLGVATPGPWEYSGPGHTILVTERNEEGRLRAILGTICEAFRREEDQVLVAAAINALPYILDAAVDGVKLREALRKIRKLADDKSGEWQERGAHIALTTLEEALGDE